MHTNFLVGWRIGYFLGPCGSRLVRILYTHFLERIYFVCTIAALVHIIITYLRPSIYCVLYAFIGRGRTGMCKKPLGSFRRGLCRKGVDLFYVRERIHTPTHTHTPMYICIQYTLSTLHWWRIHARCVGYIVYHVSCPRASSPVWCGGNGAGGGEVGLYE